MSRKSTSLGDEIRQAVIEAPMSRNALCREAGIDKGTFSRFMAGKGLKLVNLEAIAKILDLHICKGKPK